MLVGLVGALALLLGGSGLRKARSPEATVKALVATKLPGAWRLAGRGLVRLIAAAEALIASFVLIGGGVVALAVLAANYLVLAAVAWRLLRKAPGQECGCFGSASEPVSAVHVVFNLVAAGTAAVMILRPEPSLLTELRHSGWMVLPLTAAVGVLTFAFYLLLTALPEHSALRAKVLTSR